jgi:hypothetical protein
VIGLFRCFGTARERSHWNIKREFWTCAKIRNKFGDELAFDWRMRNWNAELLADVEQGLSRVAAEVVPHEWLVVGLCEPKNNLRISVDHSLAPRARQASECGPLLNNLDEPFIFERRSEFDHAIGKNRAFIGTKYRKILTDDACFGVVLGLFGKALV